MKCQSIGSRNTRESQILGHLGLSNKEVVVFCRLRTSFQCLTKTLRSTPWRSEKSSFVAIRSRFDEEWKSVGGEGRVLPQAKETRTFHDIRPLSSLNKSNSVCTTHICELRTQDRLSRFWLPTEEKRKRREYTYHPDWRGLLLTQQLITENHIWNESIIPPFIQFLSSSRQRRCLGIDYSNVNTLKLCNQSTPLGFEM